MKLLGFRVKDFRSINDTGWIDCQNVTAFAGANESGKSNLFMALIKLMNAKSRGDSLEDDEAPEEEPISGKLKSKYLSQIKINKDVPIDRWDELMPDINSKEFIFAEFKITDEINNALKEFNPSYVSANSLIISKTYGAEYSVNILESFSEPVKSDALEYIVSKIPNFAYFKEVTEMDSNVDLLALALKLTKKAKGKVLTPKENLYASLLKCLEIWESTLLNSIATAYGDYLTLETKKEVDLRVILKNDPHLNERLKRGFAKLNSEFLKWWGKDDVTIGFEPSPKGIIILVIDKEGRKFRLENRSTGFRRFFALFLSFSLNKASDYANSILLFDEAGAALHPLVQRKMEEFFSYLGDAGTQILYNTHTSYMLSVKNLNRVRVVYKDELNHTQVNSKLRINDTKSNELSLFPIQSALALYVAEKAFAGCVPIVVLNEWDQAYIALIKNILSAKGKLNTVYETLVFATGENGIDAAAEAFSEGDNLPIVLLPSDTVGKNVKQRLLSTKYKNNPNKVLDLAYFSSDLEKFEDLIPTNFIEIFSRLYLTSILGEKFVYNKGQKLLTQIEEYARGNNIILPKDYRSEIAKRMKLNTMINFKNVHIKAKYKALWVKIWKTLLSVQ